MHAILMFAVLATAQLNCDDGLCVFRTYAVNHEGLTFDVKGVMVDGKVRWEPGDSFNAASFEAAKKAARKPERTPKAEPGPAPDASIGQAARSVPNYGLEPARMKHEPVYTLPSEEAKRFVQEAKEGRSGGKLHVTVIGPDDARAAVMRDLKTHPAFEGLRDDLMIQGYRPDRWPVSPTLGFVVDGRPTILVQSARGPSDPKGGKVVFRAQDYSIGPEALAEAIRKANPDYQPSKDPGPANHRPLPGVCPLGFTKDHWPYILAVGIGLIALSKLPRKGA